MDAIDTLSEEKLRKTFKIVSDLFPDIRRHVAGQLLIDSDQLEVKRSAAVAQKGSNVAANNTEAENANENRKGHAHGRGIVSDQHHAQGGEKVASKARARPVEALAAETKRLRPRYAWCANCKKEYDVLENSSTSCRYHTERDAPSEEPENMEYREEDLDTPETRVNWPHEFIFGCCGGNLAEIRNGCVIGWHVEDVSQREAKKTKVSI
ncbi:hypothetical protein BJX66DRAFT_309651 [Aspergillus keveii]|uniref:Uncharacterized protein n=1 Tax=Aspergillus keveii TaxID=714993 RepID=A0ABR4FXP5_9EURO